jgi:hypothetical protein
MKKKPETKNLVTLSLLNMPHSPPTKIRGHTVSFILILRKPREGQAAVQPRQGLLSPKVISK